MQQLLLTPIVTHSAKQYARERIRTLHSDYEHFRAVYPPEVRLDWYTESLRWRLPMEWAHILLQFLSLSFDVTLTHLTPPPTQENQ